MATLIRTPQLVTCAPGRPRSADSMRDVGVVDDGALLVQDDGTIGFVGRYEDWKASPQAAGVPTVSTRGCVVPGLVDAHTHPIWVGNRIDEFLMRAQGATYLQIHEQGGGIASTVRTSRSASDEMLLERTCGALSRMLAHGTTTAECKSGYGLSVSEELRHLRLLRQAAQRVGLQVVPTFLGAHALPVEYQNDRRGYVDLVVQAMLPQVVDERLADFCDVFCDEGAFTLDESRHILEAARAVGLGLRIHAEEFAYTGGARMAAELGAVSCDHLLALKTQDFPVLRERGTVATLMPGTAFFLGKESYAPARALIDSGVPVAVATDFNAGSCLGESMQMAMSLGVLKMKMTPEEALLAATVNGAWAVGRGDTVGSLEVGKRADFLVLQTSDYREWPYHFGVNMVQEVYLSGRRVVTSPLKGVPQ